MDAELVDRLRAVAEEAVQGAWLAVVHGVDRFEGTLAGRDRARHDLPETQELATRLGALQDEPAARSDLDAIEDRTS